VRRGGCKRLCELSRYRTAEGNADVGRGLSGQFIRNNRGDRARRSVDDRCRIAVIAAITRGCTEPLPSLRTGRKSGGIQQLTSAAGAFDAMSRASFRNLRVPPGSSSPTSHGSGKAASDPDG
jgi:hypothetical protein